MIELSKGEREAIAIRVAEVFASEEDLPAMIPVLASAPGAPVHVNPKKFFCQNWPVIRQGLDILKDLVPLPVRPIVGLVLRAGDAVSGVVCRV